MSLYVLTDDKRNLNPGFGTFQYYVEVKIKSVPVWARYGLTTYSVVHQCFDGFAIKIVEKQYGLLGAELGFRPGKGC